MNPCLQCGADSKNKFCSRSCSTSFNNRRKPKRKLSNKCVGCNTPIKSTSVRCSICKPIRADSTQQSKLCICGNQKTKWGKWCSPCGKARARAGSACKLSKDYLSYISSWKSGTISGSRGDSGAGQVSNHIRRYLFAKFNSQCCLCGWGEVNSTSGKIPLQVDHKDGNWSNHEESNLQLLCPNCHSLTSTYGSLNRGKGRPRTWRSTSTDTIKSDSTPECCGA